MKDKPNHLQLSLVIPVHNEEENLLELFSAIQDAVISLDIGWEVIFVDDGSTDHSFRILKDIASVDPEHVQVISLKRQAGQTAAITAGIDHSVGDVIILLDADLQNDPADIPRLLAELEKGYDVVSGWRKNRQDNFLTRVLPSLVANWMISRVTGVHLHDYGCTFKAYRREILERIHLYGEMHRFIPVYADKVGGKITEIIVDHHPRKHGKTNYGLNRISKVLLDLFTLQFLMHYYDKPIYLFGGVGMGLMVVTLAVMVFLIIRRIFYAVSILGSPFFQISVMLFVLGFQSLLLGLIAELLMRTYHESLGKSTYEIKEIVSKKG
jgi:glycosyltransferase involved in cell wall biosynthesis